MYMANMAWNSAMNTAETISMLSDRDENTGEYRIPKIIYSDAFASEMVAYADLVLPDTTYLERWDAISLLDRPISDADGAADGIRQPLIQPDRDVRPFQSVLLDLGARLSLPGMVDEAGAPLYPGGYADYIVRHERGPGVGTLAGWRGEEGLDSGTGAVNPEQLDRYIENDCFWRAEIPETGKYFRHGNHGYLTWAKQMGFLPSTQPVELQLYSEPLQKFRLAARGFGDRTPPTEHRDRIAEYFDPLPFWYPPLGQVSTEEYPLHGLTQRPMAMYHSWGGQNAWLRQIHGDNRLYVPADVARDLGAQDGDWVWVVSANGRIKVRIRPMQGVNTHTVWTWNAIGKRRGAWNLGPHGSEATQGFLLNHLIDDLLPTQEEGYRYSNSDPITGQAAWFDLRLRLEPVNEAHESVTEPQFPVLKMPPNAPPVPAVSRFGVSTKP